jgi:hypothetical protein
MDNNKKIARMVGILFIIGTVAGILSATVITPILDAPDYLVKFSENSNMVITGVLLVLTMGISLSMMSVVLYPILRKYSESLALGAIIFRGALELVSYMGIVASWLVLLTLSHAFVSAGTPVVSNFQLLGTVFQDLAFQIGSARLGAIAFSIGAIIIYYIFFRTKLVPNWLSLWGLIGAVIYLASPILSMFGVNYEVLQYFLGVQEMVMAVWLIVKGFNPSAFATLSAKTAAN